MSDSLDYPAFPTHGWTDGLTIRDWFAIQAIRAFSEPMGRDPYEVARKAYKLADAMIREQTMTESNPYTSDPQYTHGEAFMLMLYECKDCPEREILWNSRDGVTPFGIGCRQCGGTMNHVAWKSDRRAPDYTPQPGQRYFRDGTPDEAEAIMLELIEQCKGTEYEVTDESYKQELLAAARREDGEFRNGWPTIEVQS